ncbi:MAG: hypothetical protein NTV93_19195 [Verrucomicrobia bacterium]|nr:hypothetical protein [Verrucomicrobiota bacterium]
MEPDFAPEWIADAGAARAAVTLGLVNHTIFSHDTPVLGVRVFRRDVVCRKEFPAGIVRSKHGRAGADGTKDGTIKEFSFRSRYNLLHTVKNCDTDFFCMVTLTYPAKFPCSGPLTKKHLKLFKKRLQHRWPGVRGVWFLEFQRRGAPHYHVLLSLKLWDLGPLVEKTRRHNKLGVRKFRTCDLVQDLLSRWWYEIVNSGDAKHLRAGVAVEVIEEEAGALKYAACHAAKPHQKTVPPDFADVGRFWGVVGDVVASCVEVQEADAHRIFELLGVDALSKKGRVKKYLWDASEAFTG